MAYEKRALEAHNFEIAIISDNSFFDNGLWRSTHYAGYARAL